MKLDYIIVGFGLAGLALARELEKRNKSFVVFDNNPNRPSRIIGGMYNPIILKRFTPAWQTHALLQKALPFYREFEIKFNKDYILKKKIYRILQSVEEQNNWMVASDKSIMSEYMLPAITTKKIYGIHAPYGFGILENVGNVNGEQLVADYKNYLKTKEQFIFKEFNYKDLHISESEIQYQNLKAKRIIFSEGSYLPNNPFFNYLPMRSAKGELLVIDVPELNLEYVIKSGVFLVPLGNHKYIVGATYNWEDKSFATTEKAQNELEKKLAKFLKLPYKIVDYKVGIRPTIKDRRPLLGKHPEYTNVSILNGLGTRGIILAPGLAKYLLDYLEEAMPVPQAMNISRFSKT